MRPTVRLDLREPSTESPTDLLARADHAGFEGVTFAGLDGTHLRAAATALGDTGLEPVAVEVPYDRVQAERREVVRTMRTIGCERVVVPGLHEANFADAAEVTRTATRLSALGGRLAADGRTLCYRNGNHEFRAVERPPAEAGEGDEPGPESDHTSDAYDLLVARAGDGLAFELDVGGAVAAGRDPVALLARLDGQVPLVRLRDVTADGDPVALGEGTVDVESVVAAAREAGGEWLVYDRWIPAGARGADG